MCAIRLLASLLVFVFALVSGERLNDFVSNFEPLNYDRHLLENGHQRVRRSPVQDSTLHLDFKSHGRSFKLRLKRDTTIFAPNLDAGPEFDPSKLYKGHAEDYENSYVHGFVHNGVFEGKVKLSDKLDDEFHIEPSSDHFKSKKEYHSVIYKASNVEYPYPYGKDQLDLSEKTKRWMEEARRLPKEDFDEPEQMVPLRYRRAVNVDEKLICQIHLRADHLFTNQRADGNRERAQLLMAKHVQAVHEIYKETIFTINGNKKTGFGFAIKKMRANDTNDKSATNNPYAQEYIGVEKFLDIISLEPTSSDADKRYCLSHVFTYRDFEDGVLGLAWVAERAGQAAGGICETAKTFQDGRKKTLNTGVVTFINYKKQVPSRISEVTFAHELGHNFGAKHDSGDCGSTTDGNYIMFPKATSGTDPNNRKFSKCSVDYVSPVLETKAESCFQQTDAAICGNQVVEEGEECDCGFKEDCKEDMCCYNADEAKSCQLKPNKQCSPSQGLCCNKTTCTFFDNSTRCDYGDCIENTNCNSTSAVCPTPIHKEDNETDCNDNQGVCLQGECKGSRCLKFGKKECQCKEQENQCLLCCMVGMDENSCSPHNETNRTRIELQPGAPCNNFQGYCDILHKCRGVDSEGPLERIKNLLFGGDAIDNLVDWVKEYWWAAILIGIGLIIFMAGFIKLCSVATPSSNPNKPKAKTMSLRRRPHNNPGFANNEPPPPYDIEMGERGGRGGRNQVRTGR